MNYMEPFDGGAKKKLVMWNKRLWKTNDAAAQESDFICLDLGWVCFWNFESIELARSRSSGKISQEMIVVEKGIFSNHAELPLIRNLSYHHHKVTTFWAVSRRNPLWRRFGPIVGSPVVMNMQLTDFTYLAIWNAFDFYKHVPGKMRTGVL